MSGCCDEKGNCNKEEEPVAEFDIPERFKDAIDICGNKMVLKLITKEGSGSGRATGGSTATIHYTGTLTNGQKFDSSRDRNEPFETPVGEGRVIKGWDEVMPTMAKGERAEVLIQSEYGYGANGSPPTIPPGAALIFDMEMLHWTGEDVSEKKDKSFTKIKISKEKEKEWNSPEDNDKVTINVWKADEQILEGYSYVLNEEELHEKVDESISVCVKKLVKSEKAEFTHRAFSRYNKSKDDLVLIVELVEVEALKKSWELTDLERVEAGEKLKVQGTEFLKQGKLATARKKYASALLILESTGRPKETDAHYEKHVAVHSACLLNQALLASKEKLYHETIRLCNEVLNYKPKNEKALFRRADAQFALKEYKEAKQSYESVLQINPENKAAKNGQIKSQKIYKQWLEQEKKKYSKMFG